MRDLRETEQLAKYLRRPELTLVNWRARRQGPPFIRVGGRILYDMAQVEEWLDRQTVKHDADSVDG